MSPCATSPDTRRPGLSPYRNAHLSASHPGPKHWHHDVRRALRLNGTTPRQIRVMMRREAAVIGAAALTAGLALAAIPLTLLG
ncbi:hypothetical protein, partial [Streptomyces ureilyticus]|uniref:hypothetical protein n=1 Tax=Streptomyces ureilyticus TaxID=1775131 RepID=UPI0019D2B685